MRDDRPSSRKGHGADAPLEAAGSLTASGAELERIDIHATHVHAGFRLRPGRPLPFGASRVPGGINFSIFSRHATACWLVLFEKHAPQPLVEIPIPDAFRIGDVFSVVVFDLDYENIEYGFRMDGPHDPRRGHRFDPSRVLLDPYAKVIGGRDVWDQKPEHEATYSHRARIVYDDFDWQGDRPVRTPIEALVIYEMHVRGFTQHPSSGVRHRGTYAAIRDKIPYLKALGVNAIELMPICEFDEHDNPRRNPFTGEALLNYWGYSSIGFFAPKAGYAASGRVGMQVDELKTLVRTLHREGIEVILDVVFNHTGEGDERGETLSFRGIDNQTYYMLAPDGSYLNFSGVGNTVNCNHPIVRNMVLDCLRYWVSEYHIDGFRFDLATILGRGPHGEPLENPPLIELLAYDPILADVKLIAEAWDAGGLYQVGSFPSYNRWAEWNGRYRDCMRRFLKGDPGQVPEVMQRMQGSPDLYGFRGTTASINFITAHDGFTLHDLVSYNHKHNLANGEDNRDGCSHNDSWNCGVEGPTDDPQVLALRRRQMRNALVLLMVSHGVPMIVMGDEVARTQSGNNNPYCQDNELSWLDWRLVERNADLLRFFQGMIAFRHAHPSLRSVQPGGKSTGARPFAPDLSWHGTHLHMPDTGWESRTLAFWLRGWRTPEPSPVPGPYDDYIYVAMNMHWQAHDFELPTLPLRWVWHRFVDTALPSPEDLVAPEAAPALDGHRHVHLAPRSVVVLIARRRDAAQ